MASSKVGYPFERVAVDILGPLPETASGQKYIMVVADYFTRWVEAYAIPNQLAETVASKLVDEFVCRFGTPESLHSDQGRNFESSVFQGMCRILGIQKTRTVPYHPQSDGVVERFNRTLLSMLSMYVAENHRDWDTHISKVMLAYRSSVHETTRFTPYYTLFGRDVRLPADIVYNRPSETAKSVPKYVSDLRERLVNIYELVRAQTGKAQKRQKTNYDKKIHGKPYEKGDKVLYYYTPVKRGLARKFHHPWQGPWKIASRISDSTYRIKQCGSRKRKVVHFDQLRPFTLESTETSSTTPIVPSSGNQPTSSESPTPSPFSNPVQVDCDDEQGEQPLLYSEVLRLPSPEIPLRRSQRTRQPPLRLGMTTS